MSSMLGQSSTNDAVDVDSTFDRYSINHGESHTNDGEESNNNSTLLAHLSVDSESSFDSRTFGTSYVSDGSETIERDEFFEEFGDIDLDNLSLESQPMVMDRLVDSACACLDGPTALYQSICFGQETSLLRQSKSRARSTIYRNIATSSNLSVLAAKRRSLHPRSNHNPENVDANDAESSVGDRGGDDIQIPQIQPEVDFVSEETEEGQERKSNHSDRTREGELMEQIVLDDSKSPKPTTMAENHPEEPQEKKEIIENKKTNEETQSISNGSTKSMLERAIQKAAKKDEERDTIARFSETVEGEDNKIDPPSDSQVAASREGQPTDRDLVNHPNSELCSNQKNSESVSMMVERSKGVPQDPSGRDERTLLPIVIKHKTTEETSPLSDIVSRTKDKEDAESDDDIHDDEAVGTSDDKSDNKSDDIPNNVSNDELNDESNHKSNDKSNDESNDKSLSNDVEIIDVLSMDDQDSWTPGSRNDIDPSTSKNEKIFHRDSQTPPRSNEFNDTPNSLSNEENHDQQNDPPMKDNTSNVNDLWVEEEAKLNLKKALNGGASFRSKEHAASQSAEDLWNEERMKLQIHSERIFDDPIAREAFLGRRQGRLRNIGIGDRNLMPSQSRRKKGQTISKGRDRENFSTRLQSEKNLRYNNLGRNRPSPEMISLIRQNLSGDREQNVTGKIITSQHARGYPPNVVPLPSREKDLVAIRSIEEGQRIRSSRREVIKYNAVSRHKSIVQPPSNSRSYTKDSSSSRAPYDEHTNSSHKQIKTGLITKSPSRQRSKRSDRIKTKGVTHVGDPTIVTLVRDPTRDQTKQLRNDERDDQDSLPSANLIDSRPIVVPFEKNWSGYDNAILATKELRKLEKKIERQLRRADLGSQMDQSKEIKRIEKKLTKKLKSSKAEDLDAHAMSSREIRRLEKHWAEKLSGDNENRASKLKRIKRKGVSSSRVALPSSSKYKEELRHMTHISSSHSHQNDSKPLPGHVMRSPPAVKMFSQETNVKRHDRSRNENSKGLRSLYSRRSLGRRSYSRVPDID